MSFLQEKSKDILVQNEYFYRIKKKKISFTIGKWFHPSSDLSPLRA